MFIIVIKKVGVQESWKFQEEQRLDIIGEHVLFFN